MMPSSVIRPATTGDAAAVAGIYNYYVLNTVATFEEEPIPPPEMESRICSVTAAYPWLVMEEAGGICGYAYAGKFKERASFRYSAEISVYLANGMEGTGRGTALLSCLLEEVKKTSVHALVAGITLPNEQSVALHEKFGFEKTACFKEVGFKMNRWLDVGYWELLLK